VQPFTIEDEKVIIEAAKKNNDTSSMSHDLQSRSCSTACSSKCSADCAVTAETLEDIFEEFDTLPIGSGCVSQVYRARLRRREDGEGEGEGEGDGNRRRQKGAFVVVKIKRSGVEQQM